MNNLQFEILKRIFYLFNLSFEIGSFPSNFRVKETVKVKDDNDKISEYPIYCFSIKVEESSLVVVMADMSDDSLCDFLLTFQLTDMPQYAIRLSSDSEDHGDFMVRSVEGSWIQASVMIQASVLAGLEMMSSLLPLATKADLAEESYQQIVDLINSGENENEG